MFKLVAVGHRCLLLDSVIRCPEATRILMLLEKAMPGCCFEAAYMKLSVVTRLCQKLLINLKAFSVGVYSDI